MARKLDARDVAKYLLVHTDWEAGETISNLKLLKLVYYAQGFCLAMRDKPPFAERTLAWDNGPVVPDVYAAYRHHAYNAIPAPGDVDPLDYPPEDRELLDAVLATYGQLSATRLRDLTHEEPPWRKAYGTGRRNEPISGEEMTTYFRTLVDASRRGERLEGRPDWPIDSFVSQQRRRIDERMEAHRVRLREIVARRKEAGDHWGDDD